MRRALAVVLLLGLATFGQGEVRFRTLDLFVDAGDAALAAWQVEVDAGDATLLVGVEGGDGLYREPAFYDPQALRGGRIVLAAFTTEPDAPRGRVRVARLHVQESGAAPSAYRTRVMAAAEPGGDRIEVSVEVVPTGEKR